MVDLTYSPYFPYSYQGKPSPLSGSNTGRENYRKVCYILEEGRSDEVAVVS